MTSRVVVTNIPLVLKAIKLADKSHHGQIRNSTGDPYFYHPIAVGLVVLSYKRSKRLVELICAAILHDTLEDTDLTFEKINRGFGTLVASLVLELTNDDEEIEKIGKLEYHKKKLVGMSSYGLYLKLADRLHNVSDNPSKKMVTETFELMAHLKKRRKLTKSQSAMVQEIIRICRVAS
jgi:(p)ppGpp synthase/HD superfamily hydrolase